VIFARLLTPTLTASLSPVTPSPLPVPPVPFFSPPCRSRMSFPLLPHAQIRYGLDLPRRPTSPPRHRYCVGAPTVCKPTLIHFRRSRHVRGPRIFPVCFLVYDVTRLCRICSRVHTVILSDAFSKQYIPLGSISPSLFQRFSKPPSVFILRPGISLSITVIVSLTWILILGSKIQTGA
jgi:hypothetical protein